MSWRPILDGGLADRARAAIDAISDDLPRHAPSDRFSLATGAAGLAIYHAYAHDESRATEYLECAVDAVSDGHVLPGLHGGFTGVAWTMAHLQPETGAAEDSEADAALLDLVRRSPWTRPYDLISGLVGFAVHAVEQHRRGAPSGALILEQIVQRLEEMVEPAREGLTILSFPAGESAEMRQEFPDGIYNLGVAHGVPGLVGILGSVPGPRARRLRDGFAAWLRSVIAADPLGAQLPYYIDKRSSDKRGSSRAAWCYGDPGAAVALLRGARAAGDPMLEDLALTIGRAAAARSVAGSAIVDAGLCHGAAGLLHIFNRLYQATGEPRFCAAAVLWAEETLRYQGHGGVGGYQRYQSEEIGSGLADPGLLMGAAGIGLALLAATSDVEPRWDAALLCDVPPIG